MLSITLTLQQLSTVLSCSLSEFGKATQKLDKFTYSNSVIRSTMFIEGVILLRKCPTHQILCWCMWTRPTLNLVGAVEIELSFTWRESSPIATLNIYALIFRLRSLRNLYSLKLYASINICIILHVPPVKSSSTFPILHPTVLLRRKFIHACSGIKVTISYNSQKMGYPSIKCAGDWLRVCIIIRYSQYMYFQLLINRNILLIE